MNAQPLTSAQLARQQQALLQALFVRPGTVAAQTALADLSDQLASANSQTLRGLSAYQANGHASAERALLSAYPVIAALIGHDNFAALARDLWHAHPPQKGDLAQWGNDLPVFLDDNAQLADEPYLGDVARVEWALHLADNAPDAQPDLSSFARLTNEDPKGLALTLAPGTAVITSLYPVTSLVSAHLYETPSLEEAGRRLGQGQAEQALVWRQRLYPRVDGLAPAAAALLAAMLQGANLPQALDAATQIDSEDPSFDFADWLTTAVTEGLVIGVHSLRKSDPGLPEDIAP